ncbi:MAG: alpha/beta hydrolase [Desulfovibrio sp.]|jgi:acetyl esterase/lipase|nr:alpha/beta hydrolase [Desulfovibrio sp.]
MKSAKYTLLNLCLALLITSPTNAQELLPRNIPVPQTVSPELGAIISVRPSSDWDKHPKTPQEWKIWAEQSAQAGAKDLPLLCEKMGVTVEPDLIAGVKVFWVTPKIIAPANRDRLLIHFHGGGYVLLPGESGTGEAILMAGHGNIRIVSVDYRMPPDFPYPAAMDDALAVYRELLKTHPADKIGVFGTSTGGAMTLALAIRVKAEGLPLPAALAPGTPWTDLSKTGDSYFTNEGVDNVLVGYGGWVGAAAKLYANGQDLKDPMLSPVYGNVSGFPPTLLTSGTRDLFLSNTVRMHLKLREAGVLADLIVFEGVSHAQYLMSLDAPESKFHFSELSHFFDQHLAQ